MKRYGIWIFSMLLILGIILNICIPVSANEVDFDIKKMDFADDSEGFGSEANIFKDADIITITSTKLGENVILTMVVNGTIYLTASTYQDVSAIYYFKIDINYDGKDDWLVTSGNLVLGMNNTFLHNNEDTYTYYPNSSGNGTNVLSIEFKLSLISDIETIDSWDIYGETSITTKSEPCCITKAQDIAPDTGFIVDSDADNDGDGMPNGWESDFDLNPNNQSDADSDPDEDLFTNLEEFTYSTNPQDPNDHPFTLNKEIGITIINPTEGEKITISKNSDSYYQAIGTAISPSKNNIEYIEYKLESALNITDWNLCKDTSMNNDWSTWEAQISTYYDLDLDNETTIYQYKLVVRAWTDKKDYNFTNVTFEFDFEDIDDRADGADDKKDDKGFLSGYELIAVISAVIIVLVVTMRRRK